MGWGGGARRDVLDRLTTAGGAPPPPSPQGCIGREEGRGGRGVWPGPPPPRVPLWSLWFEAEILLAPKAPRQNFGCQPQTSEGHGDCIHLGLCAAWTRGGGAYGCLGVGLHSVQHTMPPPPPYTFVMLFDCGPPCRTRERGAPSHLPPERQPCPACPLPPPPPVTTCIQNHAAPNHHHHLRPTCSTERCFTVILMAASSSV